MHCVREIRSACEMRCGALGDLFHFTLRPKEKYFTIHKVNYFTFGVSRIFHLKHNRFYDKINSSINKNLLNGGVHFEEKVYLVDEA